MSSIVEFKHASRPLKFSKNQVKTVGELKQCIAEDRGIPVNQLKIYNKKEPKVKLRDDHEFSREEVKFIAVCKDEDNQVRGRRKDKDKRRSKHARRGSIQGRLKGGNSFTPCCSFCRPTLSIRLNKKEATLQELKDTPSYPDHWHTCNCVEVGMDEYRFGFDLEEAYDILPIDTPINDRVLEELEKEHETSLF
jgi:hypothetical protein